MKRLVWLVGCMVLGSVSTAAAQQYQPAAAPAGNRPNASGQQPQYPQQGPAQSSPAQYSQPGAQGQQPIRRVGNEAPINNQQQPAAGQTSNVITNPQGSGAAPNNGGNNPQFRQQFAPVGGTAPQGQAPQAGPAMPSAVQAPPPPRVPQLTPQQQAFVDDLLKQWEVSSGKIARFKCEFLRWEYDPNFGPKELGQDGKMMPRTYSKGSIEFEAPDKGMFKVNEMKVYTTPKAPTDERYVLQAKEMNDDWRCDGKNVFQFDARNKQLIQTKLPPEMQGQAIAEGPLPFLFGAKADKMKARYFVIPSDRPDRPNEYWLEAFPKYRGDAANYQKVQIVLDKQTFLPQVMQLFPPNFHEINNREYVTYQFTDQKTNWNPALVALNPFAANVFAPKLPAGWTLKIEDPAAAANQTPPPPGGQGQTQAPRPPLR